MLNVIITTTYFHIQFSLFKAHWPGSYNQMLYKKDSISHRSMFIIIFPGISLDQESSPAHVLRDHLWLYWVYSFLFTSWLYILIVCGHVIGNSILCDNVYFLEIWCGVVNKMCKPLVCKQLLKVWQALLSKFFQIIEKK